MSVIHSTIVGTDSHECKQISTATTGQGSYVITPSTVTAGTGVLRQLATTDLSDSAVNATGLSAAIAAIPRQINRVSLVAYAATLTFNSDNFDVVGCSSLTGNVTIANPTGTPVDGRILIVRLTQDATGSRTVTWGSAFSANARTAISATANLTTHWEYIWNAALSLWQQIAATAGT